MNTNVATINSDTQTQALLEEDVRRLMQAMGFMNAKVSCRIEEVPASEERPSAQRLHVNFELGDDGKLLIGAHGTHLGALEHVIRCVLRRKAETNMYVTIDINGYRARRERNLLGLAESVARRAQKTGQTVVLKPMGSADRRTIHAALAPRNDIATESIGEEPNRRVVVRPIFL